MEDVPGSAFEGALSVRRQQLPAAKLYSSILTSSSTTKTSEGSASKTALSIMSSSFLLMTSARPL